MSQELLEAFLKTKHAAFNGEQEEVSIICVRIGSNNLTLMEELEANINLMEHMGLARTLT